MNTAYFVKRPRTIDDLQAPHLSDQERLYEVAKVITLAATDYENFVTDMRADRRFIEEAAGLCGGGEVMRCLFVRRRGRRGGVLVVPERGAYVGWAARA